MANKHIADFCTEKGLRQDPRSGCLYGVRGGYHVAVGTEALRNNRMSLIFSVTRGGAGPSLDDLKQAIKGVKTLKKAEVAGYQVVFTAYCAGMTWKKMMERAGEALDAAIAILRERGFQDCCQNCGSVTTTVTCMAGGSAVHLCQDCFGGQSMAAGQRLQQEQRKPENLVGGIVGALLGSLVGVLAIVLLDQLGYVAAISGLVMGVCTLKGYELLGGKLSKTSLVICALVMVLMVYVGNRLCWTIAVMQAFEADFGDSFRAVPALIEAGAIETRAYYGTLVLVYLFTALGAVPTMRNTMRKKEFSSQIYTMN